MERKSVWAIWALAIIGVLTIAEFLLMDRGISATADQGKIINLAGHQRMLSQKISKNILLATDNNPELKYEKFTLLRDIETDLEMLRNESRLVLQWVSESSLPSSTKETIQTTVIRQRGRIDLFERYAKQALLDLKQKKESSPVITQGVLDEANNFLYEQDRLTGNLTTAVNDQTQGLRQQARFLNGALVLITALLTLFVIRPIQRALSQNLQQLNAQNNLLEDQKSELESLQTNLQRQNQELTSREKVANDALEQAEAQKMIAMIASRRFEDLFGKLPVASFTVTTEGQIVEWNDKAEELFGYAPHEAFQKDAVDLLAGRSVDQRTMYSKIIRGAIRGQSIDSSEIEWISRKGKSIWIQCNAYPIYGSNETITGAMISVANVNDLKMAEEAANEANRQVQNLLSAATDVAIVATDTNGIIRLYNSGAEKMFGYKPSEVVGLKTPAIFHDLEELNSLANEEIGAQEDESFFAVFRQVSDDTGSDQRIWNCVRKDGTRFKIELHITAVRNDEGEVTGFFGIATDVTARELAHGRLELALAGGDLGFWDWDCQSGDVHYSDRFAQILGFEAEELVPYAGSWFVQIHGDDVDSCMSELNAHLYDQSERYESTHRCITKQGDTLWVLARGKVVDRDKEGRPLRMIGTLLDITIRKQIEQEIEQREQMLKNVLGACSEVSIISTTTEGVITIFNRGAERMLGWSADEMINKVTPAVIHKLSEVQDRLESLGYDRDDLSNAMRAFVDIPDKLGSETRNWTYIRKDGSELIVQLTVTAVYDVLGQKVGYLGVAIDVTAQLDATQRTELALAGADLGLWDWNIPTGDVLFSDRWCRMLGYEPSEIDPHVDSWSKIVHPEDMPLIMPVLEAHLRGETETYETIHRCLAKDGTYRWIHDKGKVTSRDSEGNPVRAVGTHLDVTDRVQAEFEIRESERALKMAQRVAKVGSWSWDVATDTVLWSEELYRTFGIDPSAPAVSYAEHPNYYTPESWERLKAGVENCLATGEPYEVELELIRVDGEHRFLIGKGEAVRDDHGSITRLMGTTQDITERRAVEREASRVQARMQGIVEAASDAIISITTEGIILSFNKSAEGIFGYTANEVIGQNVTLLMPADYRPEHDGYLHRRSVNASEAGVLGQVRELVAQRKDGSQFPIELAVSKVVADGETFFTGAVRDITSRKDLEEQVNQHFLQINEAHILLEMQQVELKEANEKLAALATTDGLTQLTNHRAFKEKLSFLYSNASEDAPFSLIMLDVDHFKMFNDTFGHQAGDEVLKMVASALRESVRDMDLPARYGGEEFAVLLPNTGHRDALAVAEIIRSTIEQMPCEYRQITASVGVNTWLPSHESYSEIIEKTDQALYASKKAGRNRVSSAYDLAQDDLAA